MTTPSDKPVRDNNFSAFTVGVAFGVVAALLFGTEEGRKIVKRAIDAIPDKYKTPPVSLRPRPLSTPIIPTEETPHHLDYGHESPPPPPPDVRPSRPEPFRPVS